MSDLVHVNKYYSAAILTAKYMCVNMEASVNRGVVGAVY